MKTIICTGTSGSGRLDCLRELQSRARGEYDLRIVDMWQVIREVAGDELDEATILNLGAVERGDLLARAYTRAANQLDQLRQEGSVDVAIVATHAVFYWKSSYMEAFPADLLAALQPDLFVTIIHNIREAKANLDADSHRRFADISLSDVLHWRGQEMRHTVHWAQSLKKDSYVIARNEPVETLYDVISRPRARKIYTSYPMSHVSPGEVNAARRLVRRLRRRGYTVFDPSSIDDAAFIAKLGNESRRALARFGLTKSELRKLASDVGDQTVVLDYALIEQSDLVVVRYPGVSYGEGEPLGTYIPLSAGVICEMFWATTNGKRVYAVWLPRTRQPSPFLRYYSKQVFKSESKLLDFLDTHEPPLQ